MSSGFPLFLISVLSSSLPFCKTPNLYFLQLLSIYMEVQINTLFQLQLLRVSSCMCPVEKLMFHFATHIPGNWKEYQLSVEDEVNAAAALWRPKVAVLFSWWLFNLAISSYQLQYSLLFKPKNELNQSVRYVALLWALPTLLTIWAVGSDWELSIVDSSR